MCGRTSCTLNKDVVPLACSAVTPQVPKWKEAPCGGHYETSTNLPPTAYTPVLFQDEELCVQPMLWGLVPFWHRGSSPTDHKLTTNNARLEGLADSKLYKPSLENDRRCVIVCDGFYEWKKLKSGQKQPYFVYANQMSNDFPDFAKANEKEHWSGEDWHGPRPLFMAGLYSIWYADNDEEAEEPSRKKRSGIFNYTVITREANETLAWLHDRMPAILPDKESVTAWLDPHLHGTSALEVLPKTLSKEQISWHPVSKSVGNVKNKDAHLCLKVDLDDAGVGITASEKKSKNLMANWLSKAETTKRKSQQEDKPKTNENEPDDQSTSKREKK